MPEKSADEGRRQGSGGEGGGFKNFGEAHKPDKLDEIFQAQKLGRSNKPGPMNYYCITRGAARRIPGTRLY